MPTLLSILALIVAVVAIAYAWKLQQELGTATRRLDRYNRSLFDANDELRSLRADMERTAAEMRVAIMHASGGLRFTPETTLQEAELIHPQATQVLAGLHIGGCSDCAADPGDTLARIATDRGVPLDSLLANLNLLVGGDNATAANGPVLVRIPNVVLEFD